VLDAYDGEIDGFSESNAFLGWCNSRRGKSSMAADRLVVLLACLES
jgi:hypothetical protein